MRIDWQKYDDGHLDPAEMRIADELLQTDDRARKELEGLRSFRNMVRSAALSEPVPHSRLKQILRTVIGTREQPVWRRPALVATLVAGVFAMAFLAINLFEKEPIEHRQTFTNELAAREWASGVSNVNLPNLQLASLGDFELVHCGEGWACFDYLVDGHTVHVYMKKDNVEAGCEVVQKGEQTYFVGSGISFEEKGLTVSVRGATDEVRWKVIDYTSSNPDAIY